jgi:hypothetical protein
MGGPAHALTRAYGIVWLWVVCVVTVPGIPGVNTGAGGAGAVVVSVVVETTCGGGGLPQAASIDRLVNIAAQSTRRGVFGACFMSAY